MRLLSVISGAVFGGAHNQALRLTKPLARRGYDTIVVLPESGAASERLREGGVEVVILPMHRLRQSWDPRVHARLAAHLMRDIRHLRHLIREQSIDVVQVHGPTNPTGAFAARLESTPIVWQLLDTRAPPFVRRLAMPVVTGLADVVMTTGMSVAEAHPGAVALGSRLVTYVPPVDAQQHDLPLERRQSVRKALGLTCRDIAVGTIGNRNPQKGHEHLIRAVGAARTKSPSVKLLIRGAKSPAHPAYEKRLKRLLAHFHFDDSNLGGIEAGVTPADILSALDVFVLASVERSEGLPTVILEAMASGLAVVATDVGSVREVVTNGETGLVVPPSQPEALGDAIQQLVADPLLRSAFGAEGRRRMRAQWALPASVEAHTHAYHLAVSDQQTDPPPPAETRTVSRP